MKACAELLPTLAMDSRQALASNDCVSLSAYDIMKSIEVTMSNVIPLRGGRAPIGHFIRIGTTGHKQAEDMIIQGRFPVDRAVFDACAIGRQGSLLDALRRRGSELVLDTNVAELSALGKYEGAASQAPWGLSARPLGPSDFHGDRLHEILSLISGMAVKHRVSAVLAPTHMLTGPDDPWRSIDVATTIALREELNRAGGQNIAIDYQLLLPYHSLRDHDETSKIAADLGRLPIENIWIKASQFGADATTLGIRRYIEALQIFVELGHPIVADGVAGFAGLAVAAFGAASGIAHGIGDHERFDASSWTKPREQISGGLPKRILVPLLDRHLTQKQLDAIVAAPSGRRHVSCNDRACCKRGLEDTLSDPKGHYLFQRHRQVTQLSSVSEVLRAEHFIRTDVAAAERHTRAMSKLRIPDLGVRIMLEKERARLERLPTVLEQMIAEGLHRRRAAAPRFRVSGQNPARKAWS